MNGRSLDRFLGCLVGGAAGDALGYPVEFFDAAKITEKYGERGITEYELRGGVAEISDDTQMTLFTANAMILGSLRGGAYREYIYRCYLDWLKSQGYYVENDDCSWLLDLTEIYGVRYTGSTCIEALMSGRAGSVRFSVNDSKECGGIMRVAPVGLYFIGRDVTQSAMDMLGAEAAAITHGHELGYIPAAAFTHIISLAANENVELSLEEIVLDAVSATEKLFPDSEHMGEFTDIMTRAVKLSRSDISDADAIEKLGGGWVAEETLAIAVYCALKYENDFESALAVSVNHGGDSDSTGAVTGNILGARLGLGGIPKKFTEKLELVDIIKEIATDLFDGCDENTKLDLRKESKYIRHIYPSK